MSLTTITTNVKIEENDYEIFRILMVKQKRKIGEAIGELISKEIRLNNSSLSGNAESDESVHIHSAPPD